MARRRQQIHMVVECVESREAIDLTSLADAIVCDLLGGLQERLTSWGDEIDAAIAESKALRMPVPAQSVVDPAERRRRELQSQIERLKEELVALGDPDSI